MSGILHLLFIITLILAIVFSFVVLFGSFFYDLQQLRLKNKEKAHPYARSLRRRPLVSIVVSSDYSTDILEQCLLSIIQNSYRKYEVLIDGNSLSAGAKKRIN